MRRRRRLALVLVAAVAVPLFLFWWTRPYPCQDTFDRVREGMTVDEVVATVGGPPGCYRSIPISRARTGDWDSEQEREWDTDDGIFCVRFDDEWRVKSIDVWPDRDKPTAWDVLCYRARVLRSRIGW
jgi:hypothetical protein